MLSDKENAAIVTLLSGENAETAVKTLLQLYAMESVDNARELIRFITDLSDMTLSQVTKTALEYHEAGFWLIHQLYMTEATPKGIFPIMVPVCKAMFPNGYPASGSEGEKQYYIKFKKLLRDKKVFVWEIDEGWAKVHGYADYLHMVENERIPLETDGGDHDA